MARGPNKGFFDSDIIRMLLPLLVYSVARVGFKTQSYQPGLRIFLIGLPTLFI
jgi:hypothetical protein